MSKCIQCAHFTLTNSPLAKHGAGYCAFRPQPGRYVPALREQECAKFTAASEDVMQARRVEWKEIRRES